MDYRDYLVSYGNTGAFGRFRPCFPARCERGDMVIIRTSDGLELGAVLCETTAGHLQFLPNTTVGEFVRLATARDAETAERMRRRGQELFQAARDAAEGLRLPFEVLDAEILLDGRTARLHYLSAESCDPRPLLDTLADRFQLLIRLHDLREPEEEHEEHTEGACETCGKEGGGSCGSCSSGGCGSCGTTTVEAVQPAHRVALL